MELLDIGDSFEGEGKMFSPEKEIVFPLASVLLKAVEVKSLNP
jgi:hypothetical protein